MCKLISFYLSFILNPGKLGDYEDGDFQPGYYMQYPQFQLLPDSLKVPNECTVFIHGMAIATLMLKLFVLHVCNYGKLLSYCKCHYIKKKKRISLP